MNQNTSGAVLVLILAAAGLIQHEPVTWGLAALAAALAFIKAELELAHVLFQWPQLRVAVFVAALASWVSVVFAALALFV